MLQDFPKPMLQGQALKRDLLLHLQQLIQADPLQAKLALEMSAEHLPEPYLIAQQHLQNEWAVALMNSDSMHSLMSRNPQRAQLMQELETLAEVLELLP